MHELIHPGRRTHCLTSPVIDLTGYKYFKISNALSELDNEHLKAKVRRNLGLDDYYTKEEMFNLINTAVQTAIESYVPVTDLKVTVDNNILLGENFQCEVEIIPENATNKKITYDISDREIAEVDENGIIVPKQEGNVTLTIQAAGIVKKSDIQVVPYLIKSDNLYIAKNYNFVYTDAETYPWLQSTQKIYNVIFTKNVSEIGSLFAKDLNIIGVFTEAIPHLHLLQSAFTRSGVTIIDLSKVYSVTFEGNPFNQVNTDCKIKLNKQQTNLYNFLHNNHFTNIEIVD